MKKLLLILLLIPGKLLFAQKEDFNAWYNIGIRYEITKKLKADISEEVRTYSNASKIDQYFTDLGLNYKINKYVNIGVYYRFIKKLETKNDFYNRNRFYGQIELTYPISKFELSYRFRFQRQTNEYAEDIEEKAPVLYNRHKVALDYNIPGIKLTPSIFYERFYRLKYISSYFYDTQRYGIDLSYKFNKQHLASIGFLIDEDVYPNNKYRYVGTLGYRFTFK